MDAFVNAFGLVVGAGLGLVFLLAILVLILWSALPDIASAVQEERNRDEGAGS